MSRSIRVHFFYVLPASICITCVHLAPTEAAENQQVQFIPVLERTLRSVATTQLELRRNDWDDDRFSFWLPEEVHADFGIVLWNNANEEQANQVFTNTPSGVTWSYDDDTCRIVCTAVDLGPFVEVTCTVLNKTAKAMANVYVQSCLHFPKARRYLERFGSNVFFRQQGNWKSMDSTLNWFNRGPGLINTTKFAFRSETLQNGRYSAIQATRNCAPERSDHPLILVESKSHDRTVAICGRNWDYVFHNTNPYLGCIHSQPLPVRLKTNHQVEFKQRIYFHEGDRSDFLAKHDQNALDFGLSSNEVIDRSRVR